MRWKEAEHRVEAIRVGYRMDLPRLKRRWFESYEDWSKRLNAHIDGIAALELAGRALIECHNREIDDD